MNLLLKRIDHFLFKYTSIRPFVVLRISIAFFCLLYFFCTINDIYNLLGLNDYIGREITEATISSRLIPRIGWLINTLIKTGFTDHQSVSIIMGIYFIAMLFMLVGLFTRPAIFMVWMIHMMIANSTAMYFYGVDAFTGILLFYCLFIPTNRSWSLDIILFKKNEKKADTTYESFFIRLLQIHICIAYFFGGVSKLIMPGWFSGNGIWQSLMYPNWKIIDFAFLANFPFSTKLFGCCIVALEVLYPLMVCFGKTRKLWLSFTILMHFFICCLMSLPFFGFIMIIFNMAAFGWNEFYPFLLKSFNRCALWLQPIFKSA